MLSTIISKKHACWRVQMKEELISGLEHFYRFGEGKRSHAVPLEPDSSLPHTKTRMMQLAERSVRHLLRLFCIL